MRPCRASVLYRKVSTKQNSISRDTFRASTRQIAPRAQEKTLKVLMLGDSPLMTTGFGRVNLRAAKAFLRQGWEVATVTGLQHSPKETDLALIQFNPNKGDTQGMFKTIEVF